MQPLKVFPKNNSSVNGSRSHTRKKTKKSKKSSKKLQRSKYRLLVGSLWKPFFRICFLTVAVSFVVSCSNKSDINNPKLSSWKEKASAENKLLLVVFGASWCPDCKALERSFAIPKIADLLQKKYLMVSIDVGQFDQNLDWNESLGNPIQKGIPALVILHPNGTILGSTKGGEFSQARSLPSEQVYSYLLSF